MAPPGSQHLVFGFNQLTAPWAVSPRRISRRSSGLQQHQQHRFEVTRTAPQVAAYPAFTDENRPPGGGAVSTASELPQQQQQQRQGWFTQRPWGNGQTVTQQPPVQVQQQQQPDWQVQQQQHADVSAAVQVQQSQQQQLEQPQSGDALIDQLQQCAGLADVAALVRSQQQKQQLTLPQACAVLQQLCKVSRVSLLTVVQQQQLRDCCTSAADTALRELPQLGHSELGQLLALFHVLGYKPDAAWVRSVLQHAGTELVHYSPAELALLLLTATQASARSGVMPGPDMPVVQLLPSKGVPQSATASYDGYAAAPSSRGPQQQQAQAQQHQQQQQRRANTVLTSAWLQHFLSTFQPYIACRSAHPQLSPGHMEAVISCLAALRVAPDRFWMYLFVRQMSAQLPSCSPGSVVRMLGALATLGYRLPDHVLLQVERQIGTAAAMVQLRAEECVEVVRSVAVLRSQQTKPTDPWLQELLAAAIRGSRHLSASAVIGLLAATAALGLQLEPSWLDVLLLQARAALSAMTPHEHVSLIDALSQQQHQYRPGPLFMSVYLSTVSRHLPELTVSQQAAMANGLATVGYKPGGSWMTAFMAQLLSQPVTGADGEDLLQLLKALARMQYVPAPNMAQQLSGLIDSIQLSVPYNQLLLLREALDELQYQRGIMALPGGPRRAAEAAAAAAAAAAASVAAAAATPAASSAGAVAGVGGVDVVAVDGVFDAAALQAAAQTQTAAQTPQQLQAVEPGAQQLVLGGSVDTQQPVVVGNRFGSRTAAVDDVVAAVANAGQVSADCSTANSTEAAAQPGGDVAADAGTSTAPAAGSAGVEGGRASPALGPAQESLELFA